MPPVDWPAEQLAELRRLWAEGHSTAEISRRLKGPARSKSAVVGKAHRLGLEARESPIKPRLPGTKAPVQHAAERPPRAEPVTFGPSRGKRGAAAVATARERTAAALEQSQPAAPPEEEPSSPSPVTAPTRAIAHGTRSCRWPIGEPGTGSFRFCESAEVVPGRPYCAEHCAKAYVRKEEAA